MRRSAEPESKSESGTDADADGRAGSRYLVAARVGGAVEFPRPIAVTAQARIAMCLRPFVEADSL